jgi:hypothetical protein
MEKRGVIESGTTPPEVADEQTKAADHKQRHEVPVQELDNDFRKRAAEAARTATN